MRNKPLLAFALAALSFTTAASSIAGAARTFGLGAPQADDITVLTIARNSQPQPALA